MAQVVLVNTDGFVWREQNKLESKAVYGCSFRGVYDNLTSGLIKYIYIYNYIYIYIFHN